jgi:hypothetical protein
MLCAAATILASAALASAATWQVIDSDIANVDTGEAPGCTVFILRMLSRRNALAISRRYSPVGALHTESVSGGRALISAVHPFHTVRRLAAPPSRHRLAYRPVPKVRPARSRVRCVR